MKKGAVGRAPKERKRQLVCVSARNVEEDKPKSSSKLTVLVEACLVVEEAPSNAQAEMESRPKQHSKGSQPCQLPGTSRRRGGGGSKERRGRT